MVTKSSKTNLRLSNVESKRRNLASQTAKSKALKKEWLDIADKAWTRDNVVLNKDYEIPYHNARKAYNQSLVDVANAKGAYKNAVKSQNAMTKAHNNKLKYWWASQPWRSLERTVKNASKNQMKKSDVKWTVKLAEKRLSDAQKNYRSAAKEASKTKVTNSAINNTPSVRSAKIKMDAARKNLNSLNKTAKKRK